MPYTFTLHSKQRTLDVHRRLTSTPVIAVAAGAGGSAFVAWALVVAGNTSAQGIGLALIATSVASGALFLYTFGATYIRQALATRTIPDLVQEGQGNSADAATRELLTIVEAASRKLTSADLNSMIRQLITSAELAFVMRRLQLDQEHIMQAIEQYLLPTLTEEQFAGDMVQMAQRFKHAYITPEDALGSLMMNSALQSWLRSRSLTDDDVLFALWWGASHRALQQWKRRWWAPERLLAFTGIGLSWVSGYTPFVDRFSRFPKPNLWEEVIIGHEEKVEQLITALARQRQSNVLLVGQPGVGRLGILRHVASLVNAGQAHPNLQSQRIIYIHIGELLALGPTSAGQLGVVSRALREMEKAGNMITIIDGLSSVLGEAGEQRVNLTDVLLPFLSSLTVRVVVVTSTEEYHLRIKSNSELAHYFEVVYLPQLTPEATLQRLALTMPRFERQAKLFVPYTTLKSIVDNTISIMPHIPFPERAFDVLEEAAVAAQKEKETILTEEHVTTIIARKAGINVGTLAGTEREKLLNLEKIMHERLVNQNAAVSALAKAMIRARLAIRTLKRPIGTFLFLGPTGVGKTETAKALAEVYFGSEENMVRLDMSEFQGTDGVTRLIGGATHPTGRLTSAIADHPFTVLLLDEFEKADPRVHQLFLQVFDEGRLTDFRGHEFSFHHTIIIATSNAGAELIRQHAKDGAVAANFDETLKEHILSNGIFRPELLNRFDGVIVYTPLSEEHIHEISRLMLRALNRRLDAEHGVTIDVTDELVDYLVSVGYNPEFGARPMARAIQDTVEYAVAQKVLRSEVHPGEKIILSPQELQAVRVA